MAKKRSTLQQKRISIFDIASVKKQPEYREARKLESVLIGEEAP